MRRTRSRLAPGLRLAPVALGIGVLLSSAAQAAMAPKECADALVAAMQAAGLTAAYKDAAADGDSVVIHGFSAKEEKGRELSVGTLTFVNPTAREGGGFTAERMDFTEGSAKERGYIFKAATGGLEKPIIPSADDVKKRTRVTPFAKATISTITASDSENSTQAPVSVDSVELELGDMSKGVPNAMKLNARGITLDAKRVADLPIPPVVADSSAGEVANLRLDVGIDIVYDSEKDALDIRTISLSAENYGTVTLSAAMSGMPLSSLASSSKRDDALLSAKLDRATLRFDNAGVVERVLDEQAKASGKTRQAYVDELVPQISKMVGDQLGSSDLAKQIATSVEAFIRDPRSIAVESKPGEPVSILLVGLSVFTVALGAPIDLSEVKDVQIKTNQ